MTEFGIVTQMGRSIFLGVSHERAPASPKFLRPYLRPNCLTYNDKLWYGSTCGV